MLEEVVDQFRNEIDPMLVTTMTCYVDYIFTMLPNILADKSRSVIIKRR